MECEFCYITDEVKKQVEEFRDVMVDFVRMERDLRQFQEAVEFVKSQVIFHLHCIKDS